MSKSSPVVIVFGASRGIGAACAGAFTAAGWQVCATYASQAPKTSYAQSIQVDIRDAGAVARVFEQAEAHFGSAPQAVIANAGINVPAGPVGSFSPDNFRQLME